MTIGLNRPTEGASSEAMPWTPTLLHSLVWVCLTCFAVSGYAHSIPDIPVRGDFQANGTAEITVEISPRSWAESPKLAPDLEFKDFQSYSPEQRADLLKQMRAFLSAHVELRLEPIGRIQPDFTFEFIAETGQPLKDPADAVIARGKWQTKLPAGVTGWQVRSLPGHKVSVVFQNTVNGQAHPRIAVLFPGESSYTLDLTGLTTALSSGATKGAISAQSDTGGSWSTFWSRVREGFHHIVPEGLDHILFVLGLFLLARTWRPILAQVTTFTLAHSITLALATLGYISVRAEIVEPIIAASIAIIALENLFRPTYGKFRLAMVFIFGLIHGLGFAQRLVDDRIPADSLLGSLLGFNVGVELGQLAVIALALAATAWIKDEERYRRWVVIPGSTAIALAGVYWAVSRTF